MSMTPPPSQAKSAWSPEAFAMISHAKVLSGDKLESLVRRLQRHSGRPIEACWRFVIRNGIKSDPGHRRWTEEEFDALREELSKHHLDEVAKKLKRTPEAIRSILKRRQLSVREIRCDLFSVESIAQALHVGRKEILFWIDQGWLIATVRLRGEHRSYTITPESLSLLYKKHLTDLLNRGLPNRTLFEAYLEYCHVPKHTTGEHLLDVRRDKRERVAYEEASGEDTSEAASPNPQTWGVVSATVLNGYDALSPMHQQRSAAVHGKCSGRGCKAAI